MKKILFPKIVFLTGMLWLASCELKEEPFSFLTPDQFYKSASDAESGLINAYSSITTLYQRVGHQLPDYSADQCFPRAVVQREQFTVFSYDATNTITMDATRKKQILAEAYFLRAFYYFQLVRAFGDVPLRLQTTASITDAELTKSSAEEVYQQIFKDLTVAAADLPPAPTQTGRTSTLVATGFLAKAYLYHGDNALALQEAEKVIASAKYSLIPSPVDLFDPAKETASRAEVMFAAEFSKGTGLNVSDITGLWAPAGSVPIFSATAFGSQFAFVSFFKSFDPIDKRRQLMDTSFVDARGVKIGQNSPALKDRVIVKKYLDKNSLGANGENNFPLLRYADVLLIAAEAEARANGATDKAYGYIQQVRTRAGLPPLAMGLSKEEFIEAVLQERSWELFAEADRWYDLTRTNKFKLVATVLNTEYPSRPVQDKHRYFPIPQAEILTNSKLEQNPAWK
ncbi:MAG: RagB/SusD family nutrient uptake outer membrane protein [Cytophagales bacterium]|nr:RagB/SusD family nutrient uptake outer membrane protein [Cytophagales bacterium]